MGLSQRPWVGQIDVSGRIKWRQHRALFSELLHNHGRHVVAKLRLVDGRTAWQLAYWFAVPVHVIAKHTGYDRAQAHVLLVANCFGVIHDKATGLQVPKKASTNSLTGHDMKTLIAWVGPWAMKTYGLDIEPPRWSRPGQDVPDVAEEFAS